MIDAIDAFSHMSFEEPKPKQSACTRYLSLATEVTTATRQIHLVLAKNLDPCFLQEGSYFLSACTVDQSLASYLKTNRVVVDCAGNAALANVGDAYLTLYIAKQCFSSTATAQSMQGVRERATCQAHLCAVYDALFSDCQAPVIVRWRSTGDSPVPSARQRAEFIEAIIGQLCIGQCTYMCDLVCDFILKALNK